MSKKKLHEVEGRPAGAEPQLARDVTATNFTAKAREFMRAHADPDGKWGFMVARDDITLKNGHHLPATSHEWGAWRAYFRRLGKYLTVKYMDSVGFDMVPAQWPHEFDASSTAEIDFAAGNAFATERHRATARTITPEEKARIVGRFRQLGQVMREPKRIAAE
jgi:hypothetical protein